MNSVKHIVFIWILLSLVFPSQGYQQCELSPLLVNPAAEARFALIISLRQNSKTGSEECARISQTALQAVAAAEWAVNKVNEAGLLTGMTMGFDIYDDCGLDRYSVNSALTSATASFNTKITKCHGNTTVYYLGILGPSRSQTAASILQMLEGISPPVPVLSPYASLPELRHYPNFMRTIPADDQQVQAIIKLMMHFGWNYIGVIHTDDNYGTQGVAQLIKVGKAHGLCVNVVATLKSTENFSNQAQRNMVHQKIIELQARAKDSKVVIVYFGNKNVVSSFFNPIYLAGRNEMSNVQWVMSDFVGTSTDVFQNVNPSFTSGILTISMSSIFVSDVKTFYDDKWASRSVQYQNDAVKKLMNEVGNEPKDPWRNDYIMPTIDGVYAITEAVRQAFLSKCQQYATVCDGFDTYLKTNILSWMKSVNFSYTSLNETVGPQELIEAGHTIGFDSNGDLLSDKTTPLYDVNMYVGTSFRKVGNFLDGQLNLNDSLLTSHASFPSECSQICVECSDLPEIRYRYLPGSLGSESSIILGIFTLHNINDTDTFECGAFRKPSEGLESVGMEAFFHSVQEVRKLTGMNFSAIAFDDCYSLNRASYIVSEFLSGHLSISDGAGGLVDPKRVSVVIGPYSSGVTVPLSFQFMQMKIPVVSYASTSPDLDDKINFPYFYRTVPSDVDQSKAMIKIVNQMNWKYVGLVYVNNNYGSKGKELLMKYGSESGICIAEPIVISESGGNDFYSILTIMKQRNAEIFFYFGTDTMLRMLLETMSTYNFNFAFLASEDNYNILQQFGQVSKGSIVFKLETIPVDQEFKQYLQARKPEMEQTNAWFREFWSYYFQCNPKGGFDKRFSKECSDGLTFSDAEIDQFLNDHTVNNIMNAVYSAGIALKKVKEDICIRSPPPCVNSMNVRPEDLAKIFQNVELDASASGMSSPFKVFNDDGNGNLGFEIMNVRQIGNNYRNELVGTYESGKLTLTPQDLHFYYTEGQRKTITASCSPELCGHCSVYTPATTSSSVSSEPQTGPRDDKLRTADIILIALWSALFVFLIIAITAVSCYFRKKMRELRLRMLNNQPKIVYANAVDNFSSSHMTHLSRTEAPSNGSIHFQNEEKSNSNSAMTESGGMINAGFLPDNYLQVQGNERSGTPRGSNPAGYSPLTNNPPSVSPEMVRIQTRPTSGSVSAKTHEQRRPDLPPRDHPQQKKYNSTSSLDSGGSITPNGFPRMGMGPAVSSATVAQQAPPSGSASPRGSDVSAPASQVNGQGQPRMGKAIQSHSPLGFSPQEYSLQDKGHSPQTPNYTPPGQSPIRTPNFTPPKLSPVSLETFSSPLADQRRTRLLSGGSTPDGQEKISQV